MGDTNGSELHPVNAAFRFLLEMAALVAWGVVGWHVVAGPGRWLSMVVLPLAAAVLWGTFRRPGDHSAGGGAPFACTAACG